MRRSNKPRGADTAKVEFSLQTQSSRGWGGPSAPQSSSQVSVGVIVEASGGNPVTKVAMHDASLCGGRPDPQRLSAKQQVCGPERPLPPPPPTPRKCLASWVLTYTEVRSHSPFAEDGLHVFFMVNLLRPALWAPGHLVELWGLPRAREKLCLPFSRGVIGAHGERLSGFRWTPSVSYSLFSQAGSGPRPSEGALSLPQSGGGGLLSLASSLTGSLENLVHREDLGCALRTFVCPVGAFPKCADLQSHPSLS